MNQIIEGLAKDFSLYQRGKGSLSLSPPIQIIQSESSIPIYVKGTVSVTIVFN